MISNTEVNESRVWGPPGCGKTTYLTKQISQAVAKYGPRNVLVTSFTKAAATELAGRSLPLSRRSVGTLHSHCYRALNSPVIAETKISEWNKECAKFRLTRSADDVDEFEPDFTVHTFGDEQYARLQILRAQMVPVSEWPVSVRRFSELWTAWKAANRLVDFTDMIETVRTDVKIPPGNPDVIFVDEAQDLTRLQLAVIQQWGRHAEHVVLAGDDDQTIFTFAGAAPEVLLEGSGTEYFRHVLSQSYRVPRAVHGLSEAWIQQLGKREQKEYKPRDAEGEIRLFHKGNYKQVKAVVDDVERQVATGKSVMLLASCSYMLQPLKAELRARALPFHNPYRKKRIDWNPLASATNGTAPVDRVVAFLREHEAAEGAYWNGQDLERWTKWLRANVWLLDGAAAVIKRLPAELGVTDDRLRTLFEPDVLRTLVQGMTGPVDDYLHLWLKALTAKKRRIAQYPADVAIRRGISAIQNTPKIIIGTGHSVKGGEADVVYIFPDLSKAGMHQWLGRREHKDAVIRLGYVMMTRARESLIICDAAGGNYMPIDTVATRLIRRRKQA